MLCSVQRHTSAGTRQRRTAISILIIVLLVLAGLLYFIAYFGTYFGDIFQILATKASENTTTKE